MLNRHKDNGNTEKEKQSEVAIQYESMRIKHCMPCNAVFSNRL